MARKRKCKQAMQQALEMRTADEMHDKLREIDPEYWSANFINCDAAFQYEEMRRRGGYAQPADSTQAQKTKKKRKAMSDEDDAQPPDRDGPWKLQSAMEGWLEEEFHSDKSRKKSLVLIGDSGTGMITWALSLGQHVNFTGGWSIPQMRSAVGYAVFNNVNVKKFPYWREVLGCQGEFCTTEKDGWERIKWGLPTVWCCNEDLDPRKVKSVGDYMKNNCIVVEVQQSLYEKDG